jgi:uncharacterized glyoxalase superfamily protein PhnB
MGALSRAEEEGAMTKPIPEGMHSVTPSLTVDGAAEALEFYKHAFGAVELSRALDPAGKKVMHASFKIGDSVCFINDVFPEMGATTNVTRLWIYQEGVDAAWARAVEAGLKVRMPLADMFWGDRVGTGVDRWGNEWTLAKHIKDMTPEQMKHAQEEFFKHQKH